MTIFEEEKKFDFTPGVEKLIKSKIDKTKSCL